jgi:hypothetical protein
METPEVIQLLRSIEEQTRKTNGRVSKLEEQMIDVRLINAKLMTRVGMGVFLVGTISVAFITTVFEVVKQKFFG